VNHPAGPAAVSQRGERHRALLAYLESPNSELLPHRQFRLRLQELDSGSVTAVELDKVLAFAEEQYSRWCVRWLFSAADAPDETAAEENDGWKNVYETVFRVFVNALPDAAEPTERRLRVRMVGHALQARAEYDQSNANAALKGTALSWMARGLNVAGFHTSAERSLTRAAFPPGSVGRIQQLDMLS
jgi:hypothetical protein